MSAPRLTWTQTAPEPGGMHLACLGMYTFEISRAPGDAAHALKMWQQRPEDWPLLVWAMDGFSLDEAKARAETLAAERVPVILEGE